MATMTPLSETALDELADTIATGATIVGLGESTRFAHETFDVRDQLFRRLARRHGFRALALQDNASVGATLDAYVTGGAGTAASALEDAWRPWRTVEMAAALDWIRAYNQDHADDLIRIFAIRPAQAVPADYDAILGHVRRTAAHRLAELAAHLKPIRSAHEMDEHVQRARGLHPGRPFTEHAHDALAIVEQLPDNAVLAKMRSIVDFHERSVAGRDNYAGDAQVWAQTIIDNQRRTGCRMAYWDAIAHTSAAPVSLGLTPRRGPQPTAGSLLRRQHHTRYVSVAIGFHHGDLGVATVPQPSPDWLDAQLGDAAQPAHWLDLRGSELHRRWDGPAKLRVISGVYDAARDDAEYLAVTSLPEAFDVLVHLRRVSPVRGLPT
jgi:erythromycin esterase